MKKCSCCKLDKSLAEFDWRYKQKGILQSSCRLCRKKKFAEYYKKHRKQYRDHVCKRKQENRQRLVELLRTKSCIDCGLKDFVVFHFDHVDPKKKNYNVSTMLNGFSWRRILEEIEKCEVRCANCHIRKTAKEFGWFKANAGIV